MAERRITVEIAAGTPERQQLVRLDVPEGTTAMAAVEQAGLEERLPEVEVDPGRIGIFGRLCKPDTVLRDGDRVEVYRPLKADPKEVRRRMAELERRRRKPG